MPPTPFVSHAQNGEDVVLWRALRDVDRGCYVDVGANHPTQDSVTKAFYDRGWRGLDVEPVGSFAELLRADRERDEVAQVAVTAEDEGNIVLHEVVGTGLSTVREDYLGETAGRGFEIREVSVPTRRLDSLVREHLGDETVHFCKIDVEGAEALVLSSVDLRSWRPWVLVVESTRPNSNEPTHREWEQGVVAAGYRFCMFDGLSRYYVSEEHAELAEGLGYPACPLDDFVRAHEIELAEQIEVLRGGVATLEREVSAVRAELVRWRGAVLEHWSRAVTPVDDGSRAELDAMRKTLSWRVTRPLRVVRSLQMRPSA